MLPKEFYNLKLNIMKKGFVAIAMKCNQEQFDAVKGKLEDFVVFKSIDNFDLCPWLVNNYAGKKNEVGNNQNHNDIEYGRTVYRKWNEKVFLEACGIETIPTLEEVKEYFKNAKEVECMFDKKIYDITDSIIEEDREGKFSANLGEDKTYVRLYKKGEFAKIVSYKESFVITREQIYDLCHPSLKTNRERLEVYFPKAFEPEKKELVVDKWYTCGDDCIFNHQDKNSSYGVLKGQCIQKWGTNPEYFAEPIIEATQQEVEKALKAEILKRYKVGDLVYLNDSEEETEKLLLDEFKYYPKDNQMYVGTEDNRMAKMFDNGIFAEIIQPKKMTKAEIETELGYKIEIV